MQKGYYVFLGSRNPENGMAAVEKLKGEGLTNVEVVQLDVTNDDSVKSARIEIGKKTEVLDVLINNAGINGGWPQAALEASSDQFKQVFETNLYGVIRVTQTFIDVMHKAS